MIQVWKQRKVNGGDFLKTLMFALKWAKKGLKWAQNRIFLGFYLTILCFLVLPPYLGTFWVASFRPKCFSQMTLQDSEIICIFGRIYSVIFLSEDINHGKIASETTTIATTAFWLGSSRHG